MIKLYHIHVVRPQIKEIAIKLGYQSEAVAKQTCYRKINQLNEDPEIKARIRELGKQKSTERRLSIFGD